MLNYLSKTASNFRKKSTKVENQVVYSHRERFEKIIEPLGKVGLEVGPLDKPFLDKKDCDVLYVDYFDEEHLKKKIQGNNNRNPDNIVNLDYVLNGRKINKVVDRTVDYVFTSHVLEHLPNLIGWLNDVEKILNHNGMIFSVVPDSRLCFDIERPLTTLGELVENHIFDRQTPAPRHAFDQRFYHKNVKASELWEDYTNHKNQVSRTFNAQQSMNAFKIAQSRYHDCHVNLFSPDSIEEVIKASYEMGLHRFELIDVSRPHRGKLDFCVALKLN